jgi:hypothetical protein
MLLQRVEVPKDASFYVLFECIDAFRKLAHIDDDRHNNQVVDDMISALNHAAASGWFYVNPRLDTQLIAYCDAYRKPFWFVVMKAEGKNFTAIEKDYAVITVLGHRDRKFQAAIEEHRALTEPTPAD